MTTAFDIPVRLDIDSHAPTFMKALAHLDNAAAKELDRVGFDPGLAQLLRLRVSQLNGCAYCVDMHTKDARTAGESEERIAGVTVWEETPFFTAAERAALGFAEAMARMAVDHVPAAAYDAVSPHWSPDEIGALVGLVVAISAWNAVGVSVRPWAAGG